jgi:RHS repeat-associated protein
MTEQTQRDATTTTIGLADEVQTAAGSTGTLTSQFSVSGVTLSGPQLTTVLLALRQPPSVEWFHHDQLGSTRALTDSVGRTAMTASYDPYGNLLGGAPSSAEQVTTNLLFNGQYRDGETGFYYLRARYFDPASGQFLSRDAAVSVTRSPYGYVSGNPLNATDPSGLGGVDDAELQGGVPVFGISEVEAEMAQRDAIGEARSMQEDAQAQAEADAATYEANSAEECAQASAQAEIRGYTRHGLNQAISREGVGVAPRAIYDAVNNPLKVVPQGNGTTMYVGSDATVVLNESGQVVTTWPNNSSGFRGGQ